MSTKYWTICYPGEFNQHVQETFSEDQILDSYYEYWVKRMREVGRQELISEQNCLNDWVTIHWAVRTDELGKVINDN